MYIYFLIQHVHNYPIAYIGRCIFMYKKLWYIILIIIIIIVIISERVIVFNTQQFQ